MRLLVVGGSGFIGRRVRAVAGRAGAECFWTSVSVPEDPDPRWAKLDLTQVPPAALGDLLAELRFDAVVNCAGLLSGSRDALVAANVLGVATLLDALRRCAGPTRFVHLGSAAEYGPGRPGTSAGEDGPARPVSVYGETKLAAKRLVAAGREAGIDAVVLRIFNPIGPGAPPAGVVGKAARALRAASQAGSRSIRLGRLDAYRDYVDVDDVAAAVLRAAEQRSPEPVLNVGRGRAVQTRDVVRMLADIAGFDGEIVEDGPASSRSNDVVWQQADVGRIARVLAWQATTELRDSLSLLWSEPGGQGFAPTWPWIGDSATTQAVRSPFSGRPATIIMGR